MKTTIMAEEKLSIDNLEELPVEGLVEENTQEQAPEAEPTSESAPTDFLKAINKAIGVEEEAEAKPEAEKEPEAAEPEAATPKKKPEPTAEQPRDQPRMICEGGGRA